MRSDRRVAILMATAVLAASPAERPATQRPVYSSDVDLITLSVAVLDPGGEPIIDLGKRDFTILEDGSEMPVALLLRPGETPLDVALLIDLSNSMRRRDWRRNTEDFLGALADGDCVFLLGFSTDVGGSLWGAPDDEIVQQAVGEAQAYGGTAFYDALLVGITEMEQSSETRTFRGSTRADLNPEMSGRRLLRANPSTTCPASVGEGSPTRRRALIVISDGVDSASTAELDDVRVAAQLAGLPIFPVQIARGERGPPQPPGRFVQNGDQVLREMARITGGRTVPANDDGYAEVVSWLRGSYVVGYYADKQPAASRLEIQKHRVEVSVSRPNARVLHRPARYRQAVDTTAARSWLAEAKRFLEQGTPEPALVALDRAISADPGLASAWFQRALVLAQEGKLEAAWSDALRATNAGPGVIEYHDLAMMVALDLGKSADAWRQAIIAAQAGGDLDPHRARLLAGAPAPDDLQERLAAPRVAVARPYVDSTNRLMESVLGAVTLALRQEFAKRPDTALVRDPTLARYVVTVRGVQLNSAPLRLRVRIDLSARSGKRLRSETLELRDLDNPSAVRAALADTIQSSVESLQRDQ